MDGRAEGSVADMGMTMPGLVGDAEQIERLRDTAARAHSWQRATVMVDGVAGIGKRYAWAQP